MFLTGKNYEYVSGIGGTVYNTKDIPFIGLEEFVKTDSRLIQDGNKSALEKMHSKAFDDWTLYFKQIDSFLTI